MSPEIASFESDCIAAGVSPQAAFKAGGLAPSTWFRWKSNETSPTLRSLDAARQGLASLIGHGGAVSVDNAAVLAPGAALGAGAKIEIVQ